MQKRENIYRRKDRRWEGRYMVGRRENGKPRYRSVYASSRAAAQEKLLVRKYEQYGRQPLTDPWGAGKGDAIAYQPQDGVPPAL